jgi:hypothetical protein
MSLSTKIRNGALTLGALGAVAVGSSAIAGAATSSSSSSSTPSTSTAAPSPSATRPDPTKPGGHVGANGKAEQALPADVAAKVKAAAEAKIPNGTVLRVETDVDHGSPYEAHVREADGTEVEVLVNANFTVTAVNTMGHR